MGQRREREAEREAERAVRGIQTVRAKLTEKEIRGIMKDEVN